MSAHRLPCFLAMVVLAALPIAHRASAQLALPVTRTDLTIVNALDQVSVLIDLGTVPFRPALRIEASPDAQHVDAELSIELTNYTGDYSGGASQSSCNGLTQPDFSDPAVGPTFIEKQLWFCQPITLGGFWEDKTVRAFVRVVDPGVNGYPLTVDATARGITVVPFSSNSFEVDPDVTPQTIGLNASKDTVVYQARAVNSNGAGESLWAGTDYRLAGTPPFFVPVWSRLNSLIAFDVVSALPFNAVITNADLSIYALELQSGGGLVSLYESEAHADSETWFEGDADAVGTEFFGTPDPLAEGATWFNRQDTEFPWVTRGGDWGGPPLSSITINTLGSKLFSSPDLDAAVQDMVDGQNSDDGFVLVGPRSLATSSDQGVRFASSEYGTSSSSIRPQLRIDYVPAGPSSTGRMSNGAATFINEGENFHWIYDLDDDDIYVTPIGGVCSFEETPDRAFTDYTYSYEGTPGFVGVDCCTWQIDAPQTGTLGVGEALFFHGLDATEPANFPPDSDGDGIGDGCDNCVNVANGPFLGMCVSEWDAPTGTACQADVDCGPGATCSQSQEDTDLDGVGNACPEPGFGMGVLLGVMGTAAVGRRRERPSEGQAIPNG